jgi:outer membrane lipoprotein-sorting protein
MMTTTLRRLIIAALLLTWVPVVSAQTVDEIIEKHLTALGGRAALGKLTSRSMAGTITLSTPAGPVEGPIEVLNERPNKVRTFITLDLSALGAGKVVIDQRFNGTTGYAIDSLQGNRDITGDQVEVMRNTVFPSPLMNYKELGLTVELGGKEKVGDRDAFLLILKPKTGPSLRQYVDAESYLPVRVVIKLNVPPVGEFEQTTDLLDWRDVDGYKVPFQIRTASNVQTLTIDVTKVEHNKPIDQSLFSKPAN